MGRLSKLALVAKTGRFDSRTLYAGWTEEGLPELTTDVGGLTEEAREEAATFLRSGYPIQTLNLRRQLGVVVVEFAGPIQDLKDPGPRNLVQDTIKIYVRDTRGSSYELTLGELEVLEMIGNNMIIFQSFGSVLDTTERQEAIQIYSFFLPGTDDRQDLLVLIKPTNENLGNLIDAIIFMQDVVKKLLQNDERQPREYRKGYSDAGIEAEEEIRKEFLKSKGFFGFLYVPEDQPTVLESLKEMIIDLLSVPTEGNKRQPLLAEKPREERLPDRNTITRMRMTAAKMFLYARSRIRRV